MRMIDGEMQAYSLTLDKFLKHAAKWHPEAEIVTSKPDGSQSSIGYADMTKRCLAVSSKLIDLGMRKGDRVATLAWNTQGHMEAWYAIMGCGAVCHTLNPRISADDLSEMVRQSEARLIIVSEDLQPLAMKIVEGDNRLEKVVLIDCEDEHRGATINNSFDLDDRIIQLEAVEPSSPEVIWGDFLETTPSGLCFTSGTTGSPKGVSYTHRSSYLHTLRVLQADMLGISHKDCILPVVPMFHANAWGVPFAAPAVGAKLVLPGPFTDGETLAKLIVQEHVTLALGVPTVWLALLQYVRASGLKLPSLKRILSGGAPMPPALMDALETEMGVEVQTSWGMTELSPAGTFAAPNDAGRTAALSGRPAIGVDLLLMDEMGVPKPDQRNVEGHLYVKGQAVVERYFGQSQSSTNEQGWFSTGDLAKISNDGNLEITGRSKDLIKSGGEWINPAIMEAAVNKLSGVSLAAVIARPDERWGERPVLLVEMQKNSILTDADILSYLRTQVSSWWVPDGIVRLSAIPLAPTGKIDKFSLRSEYGIG